MQYTFDNLYETVFGQVFNVYEIFKNFFGEQFVDLQQMPSSGEFEQSIYNCTDLGNIDPDEPFEISDEQLITLKTRYNSLTPSIFVWWPHVTVTNENDKSIDIQDLYAKIGVTLNGRIPYENRGFQLIRTTYSQLQYNSGYSHSHIPSFLGIPTFQNPCLGNGPINGTIMDLKNDYEETLWMLFCQELSLYVTVESLTGGPYFRLETVGSNITLTGYTDFTFEYDKSFKDFLPLHSEDFVTFMREFIIYYLKHGHMCFNYKNNIYEIGMSYYDYMIDISNTFIEYFNKHGCSEWVSSLYSSNMLVNALVSNGKFYRNRGSSNNTTNRYEGHNLLVFKNQWKQLHIERTAEEELENTTLLKHTISMYILQAILKTINYRYKNEYNNQLSSDSSAATTATNQTVCYL